MTKTSQVLNLGAEWRAARRGLEDFLASGEFFQLHFSMNYFNLFFFVYQSRVASRAVA